MSSNPSYLLRELLEIMEAGQLSSGAAHTASDSSQDESSVSMQPPLFAASSIFPAPLVQPAGVLFPFAPVMNFGLAPSLLGSNLLQSLISAQTTPALAEGSNSDRRVKSGSSKIDKRRKKYDADEMNEMKAFGRAFKEYRKKNLITRYDISLALKNKFGIHCSDTKISHIEAAYSISIKSLRQLRPMLEELMGTEGLIEKVRSPKTVYTEEQRRHLITFFDENQYPTEAQKVELAERLGLQQKVIKYWFNNRRNRPNINERPSEGEVPSLENLLSDEEPRDYGEGTSQQ